MILASRLSALRRTLMQPVIWQTAAIVLALVATSVAVAFSVHKSRLNLAQLQALQEERDRLEVEWGAAAARAAGLGRLRAHRQDGGGRAGHALAGPA